MRYTLLSITEAQYLQCIYYFSSAGKKKWQNFSKTLTKPKGKVFNSILSFNIKHFDNKVRCRLELL